MSDARGTAQRTREAPPSDRRRKEAHGTAHRTREVPSSLETDGRSRHHIADARGTVINSGAARQLGASLKGGNAQLARREEEAALRKHGREGFLLRSRACAGLLFAFFYSLLSSRSRPTREGYFPQDWSSLPAGTPSGGRVGLRLELAWLDRAETPC